jgi:hypothetical protein
MATSNSTAEAVQGRYDLVSSLYGPGTTACWFITALSCLLSWTIHPKKRRSGSIDSDFIAVLTFPVVAAAHLISQLLNYPALKVEVLSTSDPDLLRQVAAIEASLNITESSLVVFIILFLFAITFRCVRRAVLTALVGLFCFSAEVFMFFVTWPTRQAQQNLSRPFLVNFDSILIGTIVAVVILIFLTISFLLVFYIERRPQVPRREILDWPTSPYNQSVELEISSRRIIWNFHEQNNENIRFLHLGFWVILPLCSMGCPGPLLLQELFVPATNLWSWTRAVGSRLIQALFPRTNASMKDLDQAVALLGGVTILIFGFYGIAFAYYQQWFVEAEAREERRVIAMVQIRREVERRHPTCNLSGISHRHHLQVSPTPLDHGRKYDFEEFGVTRR